MELVTSSIETGGTCVPASTAFPLFNLPLFKFGRRGKDLCVMFFESPLKEMTQSPHFRILPTLSSQLLPHVGDLDELTTRLLSET